MLDNDIFRGEMYRFYRNSFGIIFTLLNITIAERNIIQSIFKFVYTKIIV